MHSFHTLAAASAAVLLVIAPAFSQAPARVRGTITAIDDHSITVKERDDRTFTLRTGPYTAYAYVVPSSLDAIKVGDFVGSAVHGPPSSMVAVELAIIPEDMRAGRISLYDWDPLPDPTAGPTSPMIATTMTNGTVSAENGSLDGLALTVTYDGGSKSFRTAGPPHAP